MARRDSNSLPAGKRDRGIARPPLGVDDPSLYRYAATTVATPGPVFPIGPGLADGPGSAGRFPMMSDPGGVGKSPVRSAATGRHEVTSRRGPAVRTVPKQTERTEEEIRWPLHDCACSPTPRKTPRRGARPRRPHPSGRSLSAPGAGLPRQLRLAPRLRGRGVAGQQRPVRGRPRVLRLPPVGVSRGRRSAVTMAVTRVILPRLHLVGAGVKVYAKTSRHASCASRDIDDAAGGPGESTDEHPAIARRLHDRAARRGDPDLATRRSRPSSSGSRSRSPS